MSDDAAQSLSAELIAEADRLVAPLASASPGNIEPARFSRNANETAPQRAP